MKSFAPIRSIVIAWSCLSALALSNFAHADTYVLTDLGSFAPSCINNFGQVSGALTSGDPLNPTLTAAFWTPSSANGTSGSFTTMSAMRLGGINDYGQIVGQYLDGSGMTTAFLWTPNHANGTTGTQLDLSAYISTAYPPFCITSKGQLAYATLDLTTSTYTTYLWTPTTPNGMIGSSVQIGDFNPMGMNEFGQVCGWVADPHFHARLWTPSQMNGTTGTEVDLGQLDDRFAHAHDINSHGQITGVSSVNDDRTTAFFWNPSSPNGVTGTMTDLAPNLTFAESIGIDDNGAVYGYVLDGSTFDALMFKNGQIIDLNSYLPANSPYHLTSAMHANSKGQIIGFMLLNGESHAFLLTPFTTQQEITDVKTLVQNLVDLGALLPANGQSLFAKLNSALAKVASGDTAGAISDLKSFINQVTTFVKTGRLTSAQAQPLIDGANAIIKQLTP